MTLLDDKTASAIADETQTPLIPRNRIEVYLVRAGIGLFLGIGCNLSYGIGHVAKDGTFVLPTPLLEIGLAFGVMVLTMVISLGLQSMVRGEER